MDGNNNRVPPTWCWMLRADEASEERIKRTLQCVQCSRLFVSIHGDLPIEPTLTTIYTTAARFAPDLDLRVLINKLPPTTAFAFKGRYDGDIWDEKRPVEGQFKITCVGGCFDRLHNGHKVLLSRAVLISTGQVLVGVSDGELNSRKSLRDLIQPSITRMNAVREFLESITDTPIDIRLITHPFMPALTTRDIQAMVVSEESKKQGEQFNTMRVFRRLDPLYVEVVPNLELYGDGIKLSSSSRRKRLLGKLVRPINEKSSLVPYTIGLTGGPQTGKTTIGVDLRMMGYTVRECESEFERMAVSLSEKSKPEAVIFIISEALLSSSLHSALHETWTVIDGREVENHSVHAARLAAASVVLSTEGPRESTQRQLQQAVAAMEKRKRERNGKREIEKIY